MSEPLPPIEWLIESLLVKGDRGIFSGEFGGLKSWMLLSLGIHAAAGKPWLGVFKVPKPLTVLYIDEEMNLHTLHRRIKQLGEGAALGDLGGRFRFFSRAGITLTEHGAMRLLDILARAKFRPDLVVIETLIRVLVGNENLATDVAQFWRNLDHLLRSGMTCLISHHFNKPPPEGHIPLRYRIKASVDIPGGADAAFAVQIAKEGETSMVKPVKTRGSKLPKAFWVTLTADEQGPAYLIHSTRPPEEEEPLPSEPRGNLF